MALRCNDALQRVVLSNSLAVNSPRSSLHQFESSGFFAKVLKLFCVVLKKFIIQLKNRTSVYVDALGETRFRSNLGVERRGRTSGSNVGVEPRFRSNLGFGRTSVLVGPRFRSNLCQKVEPRFWSDLGLGRTSVKRSNLGFGRTSV